MIFFQKVQEPQDPQQDDDPQLIEYNDRANNSQSKIANVILLIFALVKPVICVSFPNNILETFVTRLKTGL